MAAIGAQAQTHAYGGKNQASSQIERKVRHEILMLPYYDVFDAIGYSVNGNTVTLTGKVTDATTKKSAARVVARIAGVANVVNNIEVLRLSSFDDSIRLSALNAFANAGSVYRYVQGVNPPVRIIVDGGHLALEGTVHSRGDYNFLNVAARGIPGVFSVDNNLVIENETVR